MDLIRIIALHGYAATAIVLFLAAVGIPIPVSITLLAAGAASHNQLRPEVALLVACCAALSGDVLLFWGGKYTGWWLLAGICRFSINPEQCIFTSAESFYRRGSHTLLFAKFIPGLGLIAAPLAGSLNMRFPKFLWLMALGELIYCSAWLLAGYIFSGFVGMAIHWVESASHALLVLFVLIALGYALLLVFLTWRAQRFRSIEKVSAADLRDRLRSVGPNELVVIADVRSHDYYDPGMRRIKNSIRVEPNRLQVELEALKEFMVPECEVYLYCSCIRDTTSVRVAHALNQANLRAKVIEGGMKAWVKAGGDVELVPESDLRHLPRFD